MESFLPMDQLMLQASLATYSKVASSVSALALVIFSCRISINAATVANQDSYFAHIKELMLFFATLTLFPMVFKAIVLATGSIATSVAPQVTMKGEVSAGALEEIWEIIKRESAVFQLFGTLVPLSIAHIARAIYSVLLGTICAIAPVILLYGMFSSSMTGVGTLAFGILTLTSWPILWNAMGLLAHNLWPSFQTTSLSSVCFWLVIKALQFLSPLFAAMFLKSFSMAGVGRSATIVQVVRKAIIKR